MVFKIFSTILCKKPFPEWRAKKGIGMTVKFQDSKELHKPYLPITLLSFSGIPIGLC
jgi:hypothetical protein